jgi:predicted peroxiredoxin
MARRLVVKLTCGAEAPERLAQALTVAATAIASGADTTLWLTGDSVRLVVADSRPHIELAHSAPIEELVDACVADGTVLVCTQCAARRGLTADDLLPGVRIAGAAGFVEMVLVDGTQALVY